MKEKILIISSIIAIIVCISLTQLPGIYAVPIEYSDFDGIVISKDSNLLYDNLGYHITFRSKEDECIYPDHYGFHENGNFNNLNTFVGEIAYGTYHYINTNNDNPFPNIDIPSNGSNYYYEKSVFWDYIFTISKYWKIYTSTTTYYGTPILFLKPYDYIEPTFKLECNPEQISSGETSKCSLQTTYYSKISNIKFKLDTDKYNINNVEVGEDFEDLQINENNYSLISKESITSNEEGKTITILTFTITTKESNIVDKDNIKVIDLEYKDEVTESPKKFLTATVNQSKKNNIIDLKNPKTKNNFIIVSILLSVILLSIVISIIKNKKTSKIN